MRFVILLLFTTLSAYAAENIHQYKLDNGLKIVVKEDHRAPVAVTMVWYNIGSADEPGGITGVSHALEHLMFKGTAKYPLGAFSKAIAAIGGEENAFTHYDYTAFYEKIAAAQLPVSFELEADRMQGLLLDEKELAKELKVIQEERRLRTNDNPQALTFERYLAAAHLSDPYHNPVIGWMTDIKQLNVDDIRAWYQNFYAPNNATLVVVGDVNPEKVYDLAKLYFGQLKKRPDFIRKPQAEPPSLGLKSVQIHAPAKLPLLMIGYSAPSINTAPLGWEPYALELIGGILDAGASARFSKDLIRGSRIANSADIFYDINARYQTQFILFGMPTPSHSINDLKNGLLKEIKRLQTEPVSDKELQRVKTQIIAQKTFEKDSIFGQAMEIGLMETLGLGWKTAALYPDKINSITPEQIQEVAKRYFREYAMTQAELFPMPQTEGRP